jgi:hypothetical protein
MNPLYKVNALRTRINDEVHSGKQHASGIKQGKGYGIVGRTNWRANPRQAFVERVNFVIFGRARLEKLVKQTLEPFYVDRKTLKKCEASTSVEKKHLATLNEIRAARKQLLNEIRGDAKLVNLQEHMNAAYDAAAALVELNNGEFKREVTIGAKRTTPGNHDQTPTIGNDIAATDFKGISWFDQATMEVYKSRDRIALSNVWSKKIDAVLAGDEALRQRFMNADIHGWKKSALSHDLQTILCSSVKDGKQQNNIKLVKTAIDDACFKSYMRIC